MLMREYELTHRCDRCGHTMKEHASPALSMICMVGRRDYRRMKNAVMNTGHLPERFCPCDGFVPA